MKTDHMNNKHRVVVGVGVLVLIFGMLALWYMVLQKQKVLPEHIQVPAHSNTVASTSTELPSTTETTSKDLHIIETGKYYNIDAVYPGVTPLKESVDASSDTKAIALMKAFQENAIQGFKENGNFSKLTPEDIKMQGLGEDGNKYELSIDYKVYKGKRTISYVYTMYQYTLGAHPNTYYRTFTFDTKTGESLEISDIFLPKSLYEERLSKQVRKDLTSLLSKMGGAPADQENIKSGTIPDTGSFQNFAIDGENLTMIFPPYQVAAYVYGAVIDPISLRVFKDILNPIYLP
jgi:Protein of unknown function (DUF3298)